MRQENQRLSDAESRASLYSILALGFSAPDEATLEELSDLLPEFLGEARPFLWPALKQEVKALEACLKTSDIPSLRAEYDRLFTGPDKLLIPPYASVYLEPEPVIMGPSTLEVLRIYEEAGFLLSPSFKDLPDHIAAELEFIALLCEEEKEAWRRGDLSEAARLLGLEEAFLREHLIRWIPDFASKVLAVSKSPFYRELASLAKDYVSFDLDSVRALRRLLDAAGSVKSMKPGAKHGD